MIHPLCFRNTAILIGLSSPWNGMINDVAVAADYRHFDTTPHRNIITGVADKMLVLSCVQNLLICVCNIDSSPWLQLDVGSMINEGAHRHALHQLRNATRMVVVIVSQNDVVDLADARLL